MWQKVQAGMAKRMVLEDRTAVIALLKNAPEGREAVFFSNVQDFNRIESESKKLGSLADLIDVLHPADIIEICCRIQEDPKHAGLKKPL